MAGVGKVTGASGREGEAGERRVFRGGRVTGEERE